MVLLPNGVETEDNRTEGHTEQNGIDPAAKDISNGVAWSSSDLTILSIDPVIGI